MAVEMAQSIAAAPGNSAKKNAKCFRSCCPNATITQAIFPGSPPVSPQQSRSRERNKRVVNTIATRGNASAEDKHGDENVAEAVAEASLSSFLPSLSPLSATARQQATSHGAVKGSKKMKAAAVVALASGSGGERAVGTQSGAPTRNLLAYVVEAMKSTKTVSMRHGERVPLPSPSLLPA